MDILLAGILFSFFYGVSMPGDCPASLHLLPFLCGKYSAPSRTPFRQQAKTVRLATGIGVQLQTGIAFTFNRIPQAFTNQVPASVPAYIRPKTLLLIFFIAGLLSLGLQVLITGSVRIPPETGILIPSGSVSFP
jgi:hypothetical protein